MNKEQLEAALGAELTEKAALREEIAALYDLFAAVSEASDAGAGDPWIVGYIAAGFEGDRGNARRLRNHAAALRSHAEPAAVSA